MNPQSSSVVDIVKERLAELPPVVQNAITSADVQKHLQMLAENHKLHLDQWQKLENEVMLTLLGFEHIENLETNIKNQIGIDTETARTLAEDISKTVFEPIREELERQLSHPEAKEKEVSGVEAARDSALADAQPEASSPQPVADPKLESATGYKPPATGLVIPATPPPPKTDIKVTRPSESTAYRPGEISTARASVHDDPYREAPH